MELGKDVCDEEEEAKEGVVGAEGGMSLKEAKDEGTPKDVSAAESNEEKDTKDGINEDSESFRWEGFRMDFDAEEFIILDEMIETDMVEESESDPPTSWEDNGPQSPKAGGGEEKREGDCGKSPTNCEKETVKERDRSSGVNGSTTGMEGSSGCGKRQPLCEGHGSESPKEREALCRSEGKQDSKVGVSEVTTVRGIQSKERTPSRSDIVLENCEGKGKGGFVNSIISKGETDKVKISHAEESSSMQDGISIQPKVPQTSGEPDSKPDDADEKPATEKSQRPQDLALSCQTEGTAALVQPAPTQKSEEKDALQGCVAGETTTEWGKVQGGGEGVEEKKQIKEQNKKHDSNNERESKERQQKKDNNRKPKEQTKRTENNGNKKSQVERAKRSASGKAKHKLNDKEPQQDLAATSSRVKVQASGKLQSGHQKEREEVNKRIKDKKKTVDKRQEPGKVAKNISHRSSKEEKRGAAKSNNSSASTGKAAEEATAKKEAASSKDGTSRKEQAKASANRGQSKSKPTKGINIKNSSKNSSSRNTSKSNKERKVPLAKREREEVEESKSRKRPRWENIEERGIEDEEFQKFLEAAKVSKISCLYAVTGTSHILLFIFSFIYGFSISRVQAGKFFVYITSALKSCS